MSFRSAYSRCPKDGSALEWSAEDPLIGTAIADRYVVEALVGEGAMGLVYRAHHARLSRLFAVKLMFGDVAADPAMRMRFAQEADAASRLCHPNVVSVVDFGRTDRGILYLAMDYVDGETLASLLRREGPLDESRVIALAVQLCRGLGHAHRAGLVHRDFKPANVAVATAEDGSELVRVLDFGLAISEREGDRAARLTEHGLVVGTPIYISPEQAKDHPVDHRADLFALGVVLYEMLTGMTPFDGSGPEIARANVQQKPPAMSERNPQVHVTPALEAIVFRLLEKRPADRFQDAEDVIAALEAIEQREAEPPAEIPGRLRSPVLWLSGLPTWRGWRSTSTAAASPSRITSQPGPAPYPERCGARAGQRIDAKASEARASRAEDPGAKEFQQEAPTWGPGLDEERTVGMVMTSSGPVIRQIRRRGMMAAAWLALLAAGYVLVSDGRGGGQPGAREATAAVVSDEEKAEHAEEEALELAAEQAVEQAMDAADRAKLAPDAEEASVDLTSGAALDPCTPTWLGSLPSPAVDEWFGGKMASGTRARCPGGAPDAEQSESARPVTSRARSAGAPPRRPQGSAAVASGPMNPRL